MTEKVERYGLMTAILMCLGGSEDDTGMRKLLNVLLFSDSKASYKKRVL